MAKSQYGSTNQAKPTIVPNNPAPTVAQALTNAKTQVDKAK